MLRHGKRLYQGAETCPPQGLPDRKAGNSSARAPLRILAGAIAPATAPGCRGPKALGPRPTRLYTRHRRALTSLGAGSTGLGGSAARGRGNRSALRGPARSGAEEHSPNHQPRCIGRGHRPCHSATLILGQPGAKAPGQRPPRPKAGACLYDFRRPCRLMALVRGAMAPARMRKARAGGSVSGFAVRQPMRPALFQHPVRGAAVRFGVRPDCHAFPCPIRKTFPPGWGSHYFFSAPGLGTSGWRSTRRIAVQNLLTLSQ